MKLPVLILAALFSPLAFAAGEKIAVIPKGTTHSYWKAVEAGARQAGKELNVEILWKGSLQEDDRAQQIAVVQQFVSSGVAAIVLAPLDATALRGPVRSAREHSIPVVIFDSSIKGEVGTDFVSFVATDNEKGGRIAGAEMVRLLGGKGKVVILRYAEGSASTLDRETGFIETIKQNPGITITVDNRYAGATISSAQDAAMNLVDKLREADGIFASNETTTQGMMLALRQNNLAGKKKFVGFDTSPTLLAGLNKGDIDALVAQNPKKMGYLGVITAVHAIRKEPVDPRIDTGCVLVTKMNQSSAEVKAVLAP